LTQVILCIKVLLTYIRREQPTPWLNMMIGRLLSDSGCDINDAFSIAGKVAPQIAAAAIRSETKPIE
jgi:hypothetical protein